MPWLCVLLPFLWATAPAQLVRDWHSVRAAHFEVISRHDPDSIRPLVLDLEWARAVFEADSGLKSGMDRPVLVFIPDSPFEFEQMSPSRYAGGYYAGAPWRDLIVLRELFQARHALLHEYTHLVLHHHSGSFPAWFQEGAAEFYATLRQTKQGIEAGAPEPGRIALLRKGDWVPISHLTTLESINVLPTKDAVHRFYAQSWLYFHMLRLSPGYRPELPGFQRVIAENVATEEALRNVYGKSPVEFDDDARAWFRQGRFPTERVQAPAGAAANVAIRRIGEVEVGIARALVAAPQGSSAASDYTRLAKLAGDGCEFQAALGDLARATGLFGEAAARYQQALRCGVNAAELAQGLGVALRRSPEVRFEELEFVTALVGSGSTHYHLGTGRFFARDHAGALAEFEKASDLSPSDEFRMKRLQALSLAKVGRFEEAAQAAESLGPLARDGDQRQDAQFTRDDVGRARERAKAPVDPQQALVKIEGELIQVDCMGSRARLWIRSGAETKKLLIADISTVSTAPGAALEFGCGVQRRAVRIGYQPQNDAAMGTAGRVRYIEFP